MRGMQLKRLWEYHPEQFHHVFHEQSAPFIQVEPELGDQRIGDRDLGKGKSAIVNWLTLITPIPNWAMVMMP